MTVTEWGADLGDIDGRSLVTWIPGDPETAAGATVDERNGRLYSALTSHDSIAAVVLAYPPHLLAAAQSDEASVGGHGPLGERAGRIGSGPVAGPGVWVVAGGVIAAGSSPLDASARLEAAERIAQITQ